MAGVTLQDIARATDLSKNAVWLALRGDPSIPERTRVRVRRAADRLGYRSNALVSHLMAELRRSRTRRWQAKLALVNANRDPAAFTAHPTIPTYVAGCEQRAARLGYSFDRFWLHDPELNTTSWLRILRTRGIKGLVLVGLMDTNRLPDHLRPVWEAFPAVVTGVRTHDPALSFCCVDHHDLVLQAAEQARQLGYRRPGLVLDDVIDELVERRFSAGFLTAQRRLPVDEQVPIFREMGGTGGAPPRSFWDWLKRHRPDVVFTLYNRTVHWLEEAGWRIPRDIGVIQLEWRKSRPGIAGMHQHNDVTGEAAVDMVISQIHNQETGISEFPRATLIGATWMDGVSVRPQGQAAPGRRTNRVVE